ncbi:MAG: xanthine dehydrogenase family protein molybdopterin-binding subunit [Sulfobacillus acidophilus]|uniref:Xanthine dehydrogenase family protein molybdopterin-binding subunit n=1 Tax=Sulfobacillus acidophilus TaxID=53633 RepID=A0A2T2WE46_9FIRM|nr:MAG: xanthine dehydrogenase family protein molybdopterin-binding subunit [Sulfobacillus acidophilus]
MPETQETWIGRSVPRLEDPILIQGKGQYVSDVHLAGQWTMALVRSTHAHARIRAIHSEAATQLPGVHAVVTAQQDEKLGRPLPGMAPLSPPALAFDSVYYVGQPIVAILADNRYIAEDAADRIEIEYQPLPAVVEAQEAALDHVVLHQDFGTNVLEHFEYHSGNGRAALGQADRVITATLQMGRVSAQPMEPRGVAAHWDDVAQMLVVYDSTQSVHRAQERIAEFVGLDKNQVRVIAPEVGGGFGVKNGTYPEEALVAYLAFSLRHPIKWTGDRFEEFLATYQEREQTHHVQLGVNNDGTIVALVDTFYQDNGAFPGGGMMVAQNTARNIPGPYRIAHLALDGYTVMTNKVPQAPYRGAGRPQGHYIIERMLDRAADVIGIERIEIRRKNLVNPRDFPYATGIAGVTLDSGDYPRVYEELLAMVDVPAFRRRQQQARQEGVRLGLGIANVVEISAGFGFEGVRLQLQGDGRILMSTGATGQGQGHRTALAQIAADALAVSPDDIVVKEGDTQDIAKGVGTFGSRTIIMAGNAADRASAAFVTKAKEAAAQVLEAHVDDIRWEDGRFFVNGVPSVSLDWKALAAALDQSGAPPLRHEDYFSSQTATYGFGSHAVIVRVDEQTADIQIERYVILHDSGRVVNPLLATGQVIGGTVQGLGSALYEELIFSSDGQPLTTSFLDYRLPGAVEMPDIEVYHRDYPAPGNPAGYKGVGEAGIIPSQAIILAAVEDAFSDRSLKLDFAPITPIRLFQQLNGEKGGAQ